MIRKLAKRLFFRKSHSLIQFGKVFLVRVRTWSASCLRKTQRSASISRKCSITSGLRCKTRASEIYDARVKTWTMQCFSLSRIQTSISIKLRRIVPVQLNEVALKWQAWRARPTPVVVLSCNRWRLKRKQVQRLEAHFSPKLKRNSNKSSELYSW